MARNRILRYNPKLRQVARELRKNSTTSEVILWQAIKGKALGYEFHRQVPIDQFVVDFYCHELMLAVEIDGSSHDNKFDYDAARQDRLQDLGVQFIRFDDAEVKRNLNHVLADLRKKIDELANHSK